MKLLKRDPIKTQTAELAELRRRRAKLLGRVDSLLIADQVAAQHMRDVLGQDEASDAEVDAATMARGRSALAVEHLLKAIADADAEVAGAEEGLAAEQDRIKRERIAGELEGQAEAVEAAVEALERAMGPVAAAYAGLAAAAGSVATSGDTLDGLPSNATAAAAHILLAIVRTAAPDVARWRGAIDLAFGGEPGDAGEIVASRFLAPLRTLAADIRSGAAPATVPAGQPPSLAKVTFPDVEIALAESVCFRGVDGSLIQLAEGGNQLPAPVAEEAVRLGIGHAPDSPRGVAILRAVAEGDHSGGRKPLHGDPIVRRGPPYTLVDVSLYVLARQADSRAAA